MKKRTIKGILSVTLACASVFGIAQYQNTNAPTMIAMAASVSSYSTDYTYCTAAKDLQIRQGPGTSYGLVKKGLYVASGKNFTVVTVNGEWGYSTSIPTSEGRNVSGWVKLSYCNYFKRKGATVYKVNTKTDPLNKRKGPSTKYDTDGSIAKGSNVLVYAVCNGWGAIDYSMETWVSMDYLK